MYQSSGARRADYAGDRATQQFSPQGSPLHLEAASLLCDRANIGAFQSRISPSGNAGTSVETAAHRANDGESLRAMNANGDQLSEMLEINPISALFDALRSNNRDEAMRFAERNQEIQTHALNTEDTAFSQELRLRLTGKVD